MRTTAMTAARRTGHWAIRPAAMAALALLVACTVGPDYHRPLAPTPAAYKALKGWQPSRPQAALPRGAWWSIYRDPVLDRLEREVAVSNQTLKAAAAAYRQSRALVAEARAAYFPVVGLSGAGTRAQAAASDGLRRAPATTYDLTAGASWQVDLWGRIARTVEGQVANAQASAADLAAATLSAQGALAADYFTLRVDDALEGLLRQTVKAYARALQITENQYRAGTAPPSDVVQAKAQLAATRAQEIDVGVQRAAIEDAIAALIGKPAGAFSLAPAPLALWVPVVPPGLPSALLQRRPDIAAAERRMAAANAGIGVAESAFFPDLTLSASYGYSSTALSKLIQAPSSFWSLGPALAATLLDGGLRSAEVQAAKAAYAQSVANYRETVLTAFQQVENYLAALRILSREATAQAAAVAASREAERLIFNQYRAGTVAYTSVVTEQAIALGNERTALAVLQNRLTASVALIEALGGGWRTRDLPSATAVTRN